MRARGSWEPDLSRNVVLYVADGQYLTYSAGPKTKNSLAIPIHSVDTEEEAQLIQKRFCSFTRGRHVLTLPWNNDPACIRVMVASMKRIIAKGTVNA